MIRTQLSTEELTARWEDRRAVKNLMGKYALSFLVKKEKDIFNSFWCAEKSPRLGTNEGWYIGPEAVTGYYAAIHENALKKLAVLRTALPAQCEGKTDEELYGAGDLEYVALSTPVIEVGADGTAKGMWYCHGSRAELTAAGPVAYWTWRSYAVDFVKENGQWRILNMLVSEDVDHPCGQDWSRPEQPLPVLPEFEALQGLTIPEPTEKTVLRVKYSPERPFTRSPRLPEPYENFPDTFSYGGKEAFQ